MSHVGVNAHSDDEPSVEGQAERWVESPLEGNRGNKAKIADAMLYAWSERMFAGGTEASAVLGGLAVIDELTVGDCVLMKLALQRLARHT